MKKTIMIAALTLLSASAFASKARVSALGGSAAPQLLDFQATFEKPQALNEFGEMVTMEWGTNNSSTTPHAEGGFLRTHDGGVYGFYLGRRSDDFSAGVTGANTALAAAFPAGLPYEENAWNILYGRKMGDMKIGFNFKYSNASKKQTALAATAGPTKSDSMGVALGASAGAWDAALVMGLSGNSQADVTAGSYKLKNKGNMKIHGGYAMDSLYFYGSYKNKASTLDTPTATAADQKQTDMTVGVYDTMKKDGNTFFYGIAYNQTNFKDDATTATVQQLDTTTLPVVIGLEAEAASWLTLRGSVTQDTNLIGGVKNKAGDVNSTSDNTTVAAGVGLKFNKLVLDGTLSSSKGQLFEALGTNGLAANTSMTYTF